MKRRLGFLVIILWGLWSSCTQIPLSAVSAQGLKNDIMYLCSAELKGRAVGSAEGKKAADYIAQEFKKAGLKSFDDAAGYLQTFQVQDKFLQNVVGYLPGTDTTLNEAVVIGAHYDHLGTDEKSGKIYYGADDNGSGVAALLALARVFANAPQLKRTVIFIAFDGEETGTLGSLYYTKKTLWKIDKTVFMVNLDTLGRYESQLYIMGGPSSPSLKTTLTELNKEKDNLTIFYSNLNQGSDQVNFWMAGVPAYFFFTGANADYHKTTDTPDKINFTGLEKITKLVYHFVEVVANLPERPEFKEIAKPVMPSTGKRPYVGTRPGFNESGDGVPIIGVNPDSPAEKAGLKVGDLITRFDGQPVKDLMAYSNLLKNKKAGDTVKFTIQREGQEMVVDVILGERD